MQAKRVKIIKVLIKGRKKDLPITFTDIRPGFVQTDLIAGSTIPSNSKPRMWHMTS